MADMVYTIDGKGHFTYVSPGAATLLGVPSQAMIGTRFRDWVATDDVDLVMAASRAFHLAPNREQRQIRFRLRAADGSLRPVEVRYRQPVGEDSTAAQVGVIRDVTELERARAEYQNLVDSLADVAYRLDEATAELMADLYGRLATGATLPRALAAAQAVRAEAGAHPLDWAGFAVLGGPRLLGAQI